MATLKSTTLDSGTNDTTLTISDHSSAPSPAANKLHANTTSLYWEEEDLTGGGGESVTKKVSQQLANTTGLLDMTESACTAVNLVVTADATLDGVYFSKHTIAGTSRYGGLLIHSDIANTSTTMADSSITAQTITKGGTVAHRTTRDHPFKYPKATANTAIFFDGDSDYLTLPDHVDLEFGLNDWTVDFWFYHDTASTLQSLIGKTKTDTALYGGWFIRITAANVLEFGVSSADNAWTVNLVGGTTVTTDTWNHVALTRQGDTVRLFLNGILEEEGTTSETIYNNGHTLYVGVFNISSSLANYFNGFMDEIRIINGYAAYISNFSVPTRPYSGHEFAFSVDTKAKYCGQGTYQTSSDVGATVRMGNDSTGGGAAKVSIGDAFNVNSTAYSIPILFENSGSGHNHIHYNVWTEAWGNTTFSAVGFGAVHYGTRGVFALGASAPATPDYIDTMDYFTIGSASAASDFGNLSAARGYLAGVSDGSRGVFGGGSTGGPSHLDTMDYITIGSTGNATDSNELTAGRHSFSGTSDGYRGVWIAGSSSPTVVHQSIDYINIATTADAVDFFGAPTRPAKYSAAMSNNSRGVYSLSYDGAAYINNIEYITISSSAGGINFGDMVSAKYALTAFSDGSRGIFSGGFSPAGPAATDEIDYFSIGTLGDASDFGNLTQARQYVFGTSNGSRGLTAGGIIPSPAHVDVIDYITIGVTSATASDFDELSVITHGGAGVAGS